MNKDRFFIGLDLGQMSDYTALAVLEWAWTPKRVPNAWYHGRPIGYKQGRQFQEYRLRYLERFRLGTSYLAIAAEVKRLQERLGDVYAYVAADATGVGRPVLEMLEKAGVKRLYAITITAGNAPQRAGYREWHVPKRDLVSTTQVLLQNKKLAIAAALPHADTLRRELENFKVKINIATGHDSYEAHREGDHDDLVLSVALVVWLAEYGKIEEWTIEDFNWSGRRF